MAARWRGAAVAALCAAGWLPEAGAGPGILERLVAPASPEEFLASVYEQRWEYFPHNESLLPITLAQVSEWMTMQGDGESVVEVLPHPVTRRQYRPSGGGKSKQGALERVQDAFLQGYSMVVNSLHAWSEPGLRLAQELYVEMDLPVDVYMYLTPPHSSSYGLHNDVMDAWMVQLHGSKTWKVCGRNPAPWDPTPQRMKELDGSCPEVTMRGGDVMYLPFYTLHKAATGDELSAHLTVNIERQYYVWATLLLAVLHKLAAPSLPVEQFVGSDDFKMEGESDLEIFMQRLSGADPRLLQMPAAGSPTGASRRLVRPLCGADLPDGYLEGVLEEFRSVAAGAVATIRGSKELQESPVLVQGLQFSGVQVADLLGEERAVAAVPWILELARLHAVHHFGRDSPKRFLPAPELFSSLAAVRSSQEGAAEADRGRSVRDLVHALRKGTRLARHRDARAVLLLEDRGAAPGDAPAVLLVNSRRFEVPSAQIPAAQFCLGLFGASSARGRPFEAADVPGGLKAARPLLQQLLAVGALAVLPPEPAAAEG